eukprot:gnl/TRDRNA2_/TRDRNA2_180165_c0_seq1.p1 gnl/TRDRNA2_/TRDRNA2_180165_c0~~gnl/TRDRNA2_/TRDRNA2_180165_c0_seq1.p1  ORF type:complete len:235 (-),score=26.02 gnl/TRDRNA2_/TRDRNA2_180165_c0_seq1:73-717(-)
MGSGGSAGRYVVAKKPTDIAVAGVEDASAESKLKTRGFDRGSYRGRCGDAKGLGGSQNVVASTSETSKRFAVTAAGGESHYAGSAPSRPAGDPRVPLTPSLPALMPLAPQLSAVEVDCGVVVPTPSEGPLGPRRSWQKSPAGAPGMPPLVPPGSETLRKSSQPEANEDKSVVAKMAANYWRMERRSPRHADCPTENHGMAGKTFLVTQGAGAEN